MPPRPGYVRNHKRIQAYFEAHPDEWLSEEDIGKKFGLSPSAVRCALCRANKPPTIERISVYRLKPVSGQVSNTVSKPEIR
jgi:hypothetical protein